MKKFYFVLFLMMQLSIQIFGQTPALVNDYYDTDGPIYSIAKDTVNSLIYLSGGFSNVYCRTPYFAKIDTVDGSSDFDYPKPNGSVLASVSDGSGGWYIGGTFTQVGDSMRNRLAHINSSGLVTPWNPGADSTISAIAKGGSVIYIGGLFTSVGGQTRNSIAAIDDVTGLVSAWDPNANGAVNAIEVVGSTIYVGGSFTNIGQMNRNRIAALDSTFGIAAAWNPNANSAVYALEYGNGVLYAGGNFTYIGGQTRLRAASIDIATGLATSWNPKINTMQLGGDWGQGCVYSLLYYGSTIFVGGNIYMQMGTTHSGIMAFYNYSSSPYNWDPGISGYVYSMTISNGTLYAGELGNFHFGK